ncbi:alpha/beta hydrolase [Paraburkholderia fungorum]|uniref:Esterase n=1 Tax=Paraburkholderia fungorum TaxID=134537 RepID=A0A420GP88_9BURK|nr:alpha/beta hydrolase [Paraburkholderia fungorum]RKF47094.1 esterase [Paraburkholderia fungorum]
MENSPANDVSNHFVVTHPLDHDDRKLTDMMRAGASSTKGMTLGIEARGAFDAMMESVLPHENVRFEHDTVGGVPGIWAIPEHSRPGEAILHLHGGWFNFGSANAFRHLVAHIAARGGAKAFVPDYRLAPEHPFPAAVDDVLACYRGLDGRNIFRIAITGDSAGGNLALVLASRIAESDVSAKATLAGVVALSPVTDLTLSGASYETRADADPLFTRAQVSELVNAYLRGADPKHPHASPLHARLTGLPPVRVHVGDDEVLLDDSLEYVKRAIAAGVDARVDVWMGMPHGFAGRIGALKASGQALEAIGVFLRERLRSGIRSQ